MATPSSTLPPTGMWDLLIRNVTRDASPLSSAELELLRQTRQELGPERWKPQLAVARGTSRIGGTRGPSTTGGSPTPGDKPWSPTTIPPPRTNNIRPAFGSEDFKAPPRRTMTALFRRDAVEAGRAARAAPRHQKRRRRPRRVAAASARKRQLADARAVAACASAARKRAIADARESAARMQALEATLDKRAGTQDSKARSGRGERPMAENDALREKLRAASLKDSIKEHAGVSLRLPQNGAGNALAGCCGRVDSANERLLRPRSWPRHRAEDHLRAFAMRRAGGGRGHRRGAADAWQFRAAARRTAAADAQAALA